MNFGHEPGAVSCSHQNNVTTPSQCRSCFDLIYSVNATSGSTDTCGTCGYM